MTKLHNIVIPFSYPSLPIIHKESLYLYNCIATTYHPWNDLLKKKRNAKDSVPMHSQMEKTKNPMADIIKLK